MFIFVTYEHDDTLNVMNRFLIFVTGMVGKMKDFLGNSKRVILMVLAVIMFLGVAGPATVFASEKSVYVTNDIPAGEYYSSYQVGFMTIQAEDFYSFVVAEDSQEKTCGGYKFSKHLDLIDAGNMRYRSIRTHVTEAKEVIIFALSGTEEFNMICLSDAEGNVISQAVVEPCSSTEVTKVTFPLSEYGNYYIHSTSGSVWIYGVYYGGITDAEKREMGMNIESKDPYYLLFGKYEEEHRENVFGISFLVFLISTVVFLLIVILFRGTNGVRKIFARNQKKQIEITYKE